MSYESGSTIYYKAMSKVAELESLANKASDLHNTLETMSRSAPSIQVAPGEDNSALLRKTQEHQNRVLEKERELKQVTEDMEALSSFAENCACELEALAQAAMSTAGSFRTTGNNIDSDHYERNEVYGAADMARNEHDRLNAQANEIREKIGQAREKVSGSGFGSYGNTSLDGMVGRLYSSLGGGKSSGGSYAGTSYSSPLGAMCGYLFGARPSRYKKGYKSGNYSNGMNGYFS